MKFQKINDTRVVITGLGLITPIGIGKDEYWKAVVSGKCGAGIIESFNSADFKNHYGCEVNDFCYEEFSIPYKKGTMGRGSQFAVAATKMSLDDAAISEDNIKKMRIGISIGTTGGEIQILEKICNSLDDCSCEEEINRIIFTQFPCNVISTNIARIFNIEGPNIIFPNACAAGNYAIGYGYDQIRMNRVDAMITGGVDPFSKITFTGFCRMNAIAPEMCRPFDKNRKGFILGEGASIVFLESLESALSRGAFIYAEIVGYGISCDSFHTTSPDPSGQGMASAMNKALIEANLRPEDIDYINAHGTGTEINDRVETFAIRSLFKKHADKLLVSSIKGMIGHTMGAASAIEAATCALVVHCDIVPPTVNFETYDPDCELDYVPNVKRESKVDIAMNNAFAFGGENTSLILRKYEEWRES